MRKYLGFLLFVGCAGVPSLLFAASLTVAHSSAPVAVRQARVSMPGFRDEAAMVLVGTALIGLAAALRRAA